MEKALKKKVVDILSHTDDMTIATVRDDGYPQATTVSFVNDGLTVYFATVTHAQKAANLARNAKVSLTVNRPYKNWNEIEGLSLGGIATRVTDRAEIARIEKLMLAKFPQVADFSMPEDALAIFKVAPQVISLLDYSQGFGHTLTLRV